MIETLYRWLTATGMDGILAIRIARYGSIGLVAFLAWVAYRLTRRFMRTKVNNIVLKSRIKWDDYLLQRRFFARLAYLAPAVIVYLLAPLALEGFVFDNWRAIVDTATSAYTLVVLVFVVDSVLNALLDMGLNRQELNQIPLTSLVQALRIGLYVVGLILVVAVLIGQSPLFLISGLGATLAILSFVYQDALRGLVAGIQLTASKTIARGDWIEIPSQNVSGTISEVGLATIKIINFDFSVTAVPTNALISSSFKNWQRMLESGGRRVVRALYIDITSIKFCTADLLAQLRHISYLEPHLNTSLADGVADHKQLTNSELFRFYTIEYLRHHPRINQELTLVVYQREPTTQGLPLQLLFYALDKDFVNYVTLQSNIFDHLLAMAPQFELEIFQLPAGKDIRPRHEESG